MVPRLPRARRRTGWAPLLGLALLAASACASEGPAGPVTRSARPDRSLPGAARPVPARPRAAAAPVRDRIARESMTRPALPRPTCPPLRFEVPDDLASARPPLAVPRVDIEDPGDRGLEHFFEAFARVVRRRGVPVARIGLYGDSNWTSDWASGAMRRLLQTRWGDAGHGFVSPVRPWGWYRHLDVEHAAQPGGWRAFSVSQLRVPDRRYGLAGIAGQSLRPGAWARVATAPDEAPVGRSASHLELYYLRHDESGKLGVELDGKALPDVPTRSEHPEPGYQAYEVPDGPHALRLTQVGVHPVRLFGVVLERPGPGVVLDNLSVTALNCWMLTQIDQALMKDHLAHRGYDLIIDTTGTNMWAAESHAGWMRSVIAARREVLPRHSCLLVSPPDHARAQGGRLVGEPRMKACGQEKREIARANGCAFWDLYRAMGGERSMVTWARHRWAAGDLVHFQIPLATFLAEQLTHALLRRFAAYVAAHPHAGCAE